MKPFHIDDIEYQMPESLKEVSLGDYMEVLNILSQKLTPIEQAAEVVSLICKVDMDIFENAETKLALSLFDKLSFFEGHTTTQQVSSFKIGKDTYFINDLGDSKFKVFATFDKVLTQYQTKPEGIPLMMAVLCRKMDEKLDDYDLEERAELFKQVDAETAINLAGFFLHQEKQYQKSLLLYSNLQKMREGFKASLTEISLKSMGGWTLRSLYRMLLVRWTRYLMN